LQFVPVWCSTWSSHERLVCQVDDFFVIFHYRERNQVNKNKFYVVYIICTQVVKVMIASKIILKQNWMYKIWGFNGGENSSQGVGGCDAM